MPTQDDVIAVLKSEDLLTGVEIVAAAFKSSKYSYYEAVKRGDAPVMPIMVGRRQKYRVADLRRVLGFDSVPADVGRV